MERQFQLNWQAIVEEAKQRRKQQKLTQKKFAILANVSAPTISHFENGKKDIQLSSILNILGMLGMLDKRNLVFPDLNAYYDSIQMAIIFWGQDNDRKIKCAISREALTDRYKSKGKDFIKIFNEHHLSIEHEARRKYLTDRLEIDGSILIKTNDF